MILSFYIILFLGCVLTLVINNQLTTQKEKRIFEITTLIVLCLVSGTRYYMGGSDYYVYKAVYDNMPTIPEFINKFLNIHDYYNTFGMETGYLLINSLIKSFGINFFGFTLLHSLFFYGCLYLGLKKYTENFSFLIIVFMYKMFFYNTFISLRQSITIGIFFLTMHYIFEKKIYKYFLTSVIAVLFHNGALLLFFVYFINKIKLTKKLLILLNVIFIPSSIISILNFPIMKVFDFIVNWFPTDESVEKAQSLFMATSTSGIGLFHSLEYFFIMLLVIINFDKIISVNKYSEFILKLFLILLPIFTLFRGYEILTRTKDYFTITYAIILGYLCLINKGKYKIIIQIVTVFICAFGFYRFILLFDGGAMMPYESYLFKRINIFGNY